MRNTDICSTRRSQVRVKSMSMDLRVYLERNHHKYAMPTAIIRHSHCSAICMLLEKGIGIHPTNLKHVTIRHLYLIDLARTCVRPLTLYFYWWISISLLKLCRFSEILELELTYTKTWLHKIRLRCSIFDFVSKFLCLFFFSTLFLSYVLPLPPPQSSINIDHKSD